MTTPTHRNPYVGTGEDGCRRSARIDREEADGLNWRDPRHDELIASAEAWEAQAQLLMLARLGPGPTLAQLRAEVGSERWLAGLALLELSPALRRDAEQYTAWSEGGGRFLPDPESEDGGSIWMPNPVMDWAEWFKNVNDYGRGWSSSEHRLFDLIAGLTVEEERTDLVGVLTGLGSWQEPALRIVVEWATGGNNRDRPGRATVTSN